jgi:phosphatidylinositol-3-phosphatase
MRAAALLIALAAAPLSCGHATGGSPVVFPTAVPNPTSSHVITLVMENKEYGDIIGNRDAPYLNRLAHRYGLATRSYGVRHPSLPDYLALTSGATHGIESDCTYCHVNARNVVDQLEAARITWRAYMEDVPRPCYRGPRSAGYAKKHNPFAYYDDVAGDPRRCRRIVPFDQLASDLRRDRLPTYAFISPNLCNDMHDCGVATGDRFLERRVPVLLDALGPQGYLVLTWDEGSSDQGCCGGSTGGHIATVVAGPLVRRGAREGRPLDHYGVLGTIEDTLGLPRLGAATDARHGRLDALFRRRPRLRPAARASRSAREPRG